MASALLAAKFSLLTPGTEVKNKKNDAPYVATSPDKLSGEVASPSSKPVSDALIPYTKERTREG